MDFFCNNVANYMMLRHEIKLKVRVYRWGNIYLPYHGHKLNVFLKDSMVMISHMKAHINLKTKSSFK